MDPQTFNDKKEFYKRYLSSKSDINFGFQKIRDSKIQDELYVTSINFSEVDSPDQKLVLSQFSQQQEELISQKEKESADFKRWVNKQIDQVKVNFNESGDKIKLSQETIDHMKENVSDSYENLIAKHKYSNLNNYPHYKSNFVKTGQINESRCINTNIGKMGQVCNINSFTKVRESNGFFGDEEEIENTITDEVKLDFSKKRVEERDKLAHSKIKEEAVKQHLHNTSLNISKESISNINQRRNGKSTELMDSKEDKEKPVESTHNNYSYKKKQEEGLIFDDKDPINCSIDDMQQEVELFPKCDKNFTLSELNDEFLNYDTSKQEGQAPKEHTTPLMSQIKEVHESQASQKTQSNRISNLFQKERRNKKESKLFRNNGKKSNFNAKLLESKPLFALNANRSEVSKYVTIDLSTSVSKISAMNKKKPKSMRTVDRLLQKGKEYEYKKELRKTQKHTQELLACTFTPEIKKTSTVRTRGSFIGKTRSTCMTPNLSKSSRLGSSFNMSRPSLSQVRSKKEIKRNNTPVKQGRSGKSVNNSAIINCKQVSRKSITTTKTTKTTKRKPKWEEPTFQPKINANSKILAERRKSRLRNSNVTRKNRDKSTESTISNLSQNNSENILRERLLEEIHRTLENGNFLQNNEEPCDIVLKKEDLIIILQDMELLPLEEQNITEEMIMLIQAMWTIMSREESEEVNVKKMTTFILAIYGLSIMDIIEDSDMCLNETDVKQIQLGFRAFKQHKADRKKDRRALEKQKGLSRNSSWVSNKSVSDARMADNYRQKIISKGLFYVERGDIEGYDFNQLTHADFLRLKREIKTLEDQEKKRVKEEESMYECTFKPVINDSYVSIKPRPGYTYRNSNKTHKSFVTSRVQKESTVIKLELKIKDGFKEKLYLYPNDNIDLKVAKIVRKYDLSRKKAGKLKALLENQLLMLN